MDSIPRGSKYRKMMALLGSKSLGRVFGTCYLHRVLDPLYFPQIGSEHQVPVARSQLPVPWVAQVPRCRRHHLPLQLPR